MLTTLFIGVALAVVIIIVMGAYLSVRAERREAEALAEAQAAGMNVPVSLHPVIDLTTCIGSGACVDVCPESVLGRPGGVTQLVQAGGCIGHGRCHDACPVGAIALVFGTAERGVDLPLLRAGYETNVDGMFVIGELGGMGLIRNAMRQGITAVGTGVRTSLKNPEIVAGSGPGLVDVVIVGAGPAGIAAALECAHRKLSFVLLEQFTLGGSVTHYPRRKLVFTEQIKLPIVGNFGKSEMLKEELVAEFERVCLAGGITILEGRRVTGVEGRAGDFRVVCATEGGEEVHRGRTVVLSIGRRGTPRRLNVPGEDLPHIVYRLLDPEQYRHRKVLCVGGGDSSVEAAVSLAEVAGCEVHLSYRGEAFYRVKKKNRAQLEAAVEQGRVRLHLQTSALRVTPDQVVLSAPEGERTLQITDVIVNVGGVVPTAFLESVGIKVETKFGEAMEGKTSRRARRSTGRSGRPSTRLPPSTRLRRKSRARTGQIPGSDDVLAARISSGSRALSEPCAAGDSVPREVEVTQDLQPLPGGEGLEPDQRAPGLSAHAQPPARGWEREDLPLGLSSSDLGSLPLHGSMPLELGDSDPFQNDSEDLP